MEEKSLGKSGKLTSAQSFAIDYVRSKATEARNYSKAKVEGILVHNKVTTSIKELLSIIRTHGRVTLNFHPDRVLSNGRTIVESFLEDGMYYSQFVTQVTNGSKTAYAGGDRDRWEKILFGGAYQYPNVRNEDRPKYGGLNLMNYVDGASPRFGSCHFRLKPNMLERCTFTFGDSHTGPEVMGTIDVFEPILAALLEASETNCEALGSANVDVSHLVQYLLTVPSFNHEQGKLGRSLDDYIEAQVHGDMNISRDVEALVADPSFKETQIGFLIEELCLRYSITLQWHPGYRLSTSSVPDGFRGPAIPPFARRVDENFAHTHGILDAFTIGKAAASLHHKPKLWHDWGTPDETFQHLKQLWHVLVKYGA